MSDLLSATQLAAAWQRERAAHRRWLAGGAQLPVEFETHVSRETAPRLLPAPLPADWLEAEPSAACFERLEAYGHLVLEANRRVNLVSRRNPEGQILTNILDSLPLAAIWGDVSRETGPEDEAPRFLLDAGSGSGVPGIPAQLVLADLAASSPALLLVESRGHKADFLDRSLEHLELDRAAVWGGRLEDPALPLWLEEEGWSGPGCVVSRGVAAVLATLDWCKFLVGKEWLNRACFLKGVPGLSREWGEEGNRWSRKGWNLAGLHLFQGDERPLCLLSGRQV